MRTLLLAALVLLTAACGAYRFPGASAAATGTVTGLVSVIPCGPIKPVPQGPPQDSVPCQMTVAARIEMDFTSGGTVTSTLTDADGRYRVELPVGTYKVSAKGYMRIVSGPATVTVKAGDTVTADYLLDSGIRRLPVPQQ
jgi:hypothetical protein